METMTKRRRESENSVPRKWYSLDEADQRTGAGKRLIAEAIKRGELPAYRLNRKVLRVKEDDLDVWMERFREEAPARTVEAIVDEIMRGI